jgi:hypothetical protein
MEQSILLSCIEQLGDVLDDGGRIAIKSSSIEFNGGGWTEFELYEGGIRYWPEPGEWKSVEGGRAEFEAAREAFAGTLRRVAEQCPKYWILRDDGDDDLELSLDDRTRRDLSYEGQDQPEMAAAFALLPKRSPRRPSAPRW